MTTIACLLLTLPTWASEPVELVTTKVYAFSEDSDAYLQGPAAVSVANNGGVFLLDVATATIHRWQANGVYEGSFGRRGEGPGEFSFRLQFGGNAGTMDLFDNQLYVFDGGTRKLHRFNLDGVYVDTLPFTIAGGIPNTFRVLAANRYLVYNKDTTQQPPVFQVAIFDENGEKVTTLMTTQDRTFEREGSGDAQKVTFQAFTAAPSLVMHEGEILIGNGNSGRLGRFSTVGQSSAQFRLSLPRPDLTQADRDEWWEAFAWIKQSPQYDAAFPDAKPMFDRLTSAGEQGLLTYRVSPQYRRIEGILTDWQGNPKGRINWDLGESGNLFSDKGRLFVTRLDEDDNVTLSEVTLNVE